MSNAKQTIPPGHASSGTAMWLCDSIGRMARGTPWFSGKSRLGRAVASRLLNDRRHAVLPVELADGTRLLLDPRGRTEAGAFYNGELDYNDLDFFRCCVGKECVALDIGANIGLITIPLGRYIRSLGGRLYSFEPVATNAQRLRDNVEFNELGGVVTVFECALGESEGRMEIAREAGGGAETGNAVLKPRGRNPGNHGSDLSNSVDQASAAALEENAALTGGIASAGNVAIAGSVASAGSIASPGVDPDFDCPVEWSTTRLRRLDDVIDETKLHRLDFAKIDVEGAELTVLRGGIKAIERFRPVIYGEFNAGMMPRFSSTFADVGALMAPLDYRALAFSRRLDLADVPFNAGRGNAVLCPAEKVDALLSRCAAERERTKSNAIGKGSAEIS